MLPQVLLRLDVALAVDILLGKFLAVELDVATMHPVAQHLTDRTGADAHALTHLSGFGTGSLRMMLGNWTHRSYIELYGEEMPVQDIDRQRYIKTEKYLKKHPQP